MDGLTVLVVEVPTSRTPVSTPEGKYQRRAIGGKGKPECMPYLFPEMIARQADLRASSITKIYPTEPAYSSMI